MGYLTGTVNAGLTSFLSGMAMLGSWTVGMFFLRFWTKTRDRLFLRFGVAFWLFAIERLVLICLGDDPSLEEHTWVYMIRVAGFLTILFAIVGKNHGAAE